MQLSKVARGRQPRHSGRRNGQLECIVAVRNCRSNSVEPQLAPAANRSGPQGSR